MDPMKLPGRIPTPMPRPQMAPQAQPQPLGLGEIMEQMRAEGQGPEGGDGWHQELTTRAIDEMGIESVLNLTGYDLAQIGIHMDDADAEAYDRLGPEGRMQFLKQVSGGNFMATPGG